MDHHPASHPGATDLNDLSTPLAGLLVQSQRANTEAQRQSLMYKIGQDPQLLSLDDVRADTDTFAHLLVHRLVQSDARRKLQLLIDLLCDTLEGTYRQQLCDLAVRHGFSFHGRNPVDYEQGDVGAPLPLRAYPEPGLPGYRIDLGTCWGLDRGAFVGVLAGSPETDLARNMERVERLLRKTLASTDSRLLLPERWWFSIGQAASQRRMGNRQQLWQAASDDPRRAQIEQRMEDQSVAPGLVVQLSGQAVGVLSPHDWLDHLFRDLFPDTALAVLVQITDEAGGPPLARARQLCQALRQRQPSLPIRLARARGSGANGIGASPAAAEQPGLFLDNLLQAHDPRQHFVAWVKQANAALSNAVDERQRFTGTVFALYQQVARQGEPLPAQAEAEQTVRFLDERGDAAAREDQALLDFTDTFVPSRLGELIRAYAGSTRPAARLAALAAAGQRDELLDAWLAGSLPNPEHMEGLLEVPGLAAGGGPVEQLALALLRVVGSRPADDADAAALRGRLSEWQFLLHDDIRAVIAHGLHSEAERHAELFLSDRNFQRHLLAIRAQLSLPGMARGLAEQPIDPPHAWWLLAALPPDPELMRALVQAPRERRAVFGLLRANERGGLAADSQRTLPSELEQLTAEAQQDQADALRAQGAADSEAAALLRLCRSLWSSQ